MLQLQLCCAEVNRFARSLKENMVAQRSKPVKANKIKRSRVDTPAAAAVPSLGQTLSAIDFSTTTAFGSVDNGTYSLNKELAAVSNYMRGLAVTKPGRGQSAAQQAPVTPAGQPSLDHCRRWYADELQFTARVPSPAVIAAFATVPRERFVGPGPWWIRSPMNMDDYWQTGDADPRHVYHDVLIALDPTRGINNGQPSLWARLFDTLDLKTGEKLLHLGCGTGYYSAIAAEIVGPSGRVTAVEIDAALAERARSAASLWPQITVSNANGAEGCSGPADVVIASAGATHPLRSWLDALKPEGRLLLPMTTAASLAEGELSTSKIAMSAGGGPGAMLLVVRRADNQYSARFLCRAGFIHFLGARDEEADRKLAAALARDWGCSVQSLRRDSHNEDETCWLHGDDWCLSRRPLEGLGTAAASQEENVS